MSKDRTTLGSTERLEIMEDQEQINDLIQRECPERAEEFAGCTIVEIRSSRFAACDHDWDEIRVYDSDRTLKGVHVTQRKSASNIIPS